MGELVKEFNTLNQLNLQERHLFCADCKKWLTDTIYLHSDSNNYCKYCSEDHVDDADEDADGEEIVKFQNFTLEEILEECKYLCNYNECHFVGFAKELKQHELNCMYAHAQCTLCKETDLYSTENLLSHLADKHTDVVTALTTQEPLVDIKLKLPINNTHVFIINLGKTHTFVMFVELVNNMLKCKVASKVHPSLLPNNNFMIQYENNENKIAVNGRIKSFHESVANNDSGNPKIHFLPNNKEIILKVHFCDYQLLQNVIADCPICFNHLTTDMYQCTNGHCVCVNCKAKISTCPTCRAGMSTQRIIMSHLLINCNFQCVNAPEGCLQLSNPTDLTTHLAECAYVKVVCEVCKESHLKMNIMKHIMDKHQVWSCTDTISFVQLQNQPSSRNEYVRFRGLVFRFLITTKDDGNNVTMDCNVILLHCNKASEAEKYRYEVQLLQPSNESVVLFKFSNFCQINAVVNSSANLNMCKRFLMANNQHLTFKCRFIISNSGL